MKVMLQVSFDDVPSIYYPHFIYYYFYLAASR